MYILQEDAELAQKAVLKMKYIKIGLTIKSILTPKQYVVFRFKIINNIKYSVIANIMGLSQSTVRGHYHLAVKKIRNL